MEAKDRLRYDEKEEFLDKAFKDTGVEIYPEAIKN